MLIGRIGDFHYLNDNVEFAFKSRLLAFGIRIMFNCIFDPIQGHEGVLVENELVLEVFTRPFSELSHFLSVRGSQTELWPRSLVRLGQPQVARACRHAEEGVHF